MQTYTIEQLWRRSNEKKGLKVRFNDWNYNIKYFTIAGESSDAKRFVGKLDNGEAISFSKKSRGWSFYSTEAENNAKAV